MIFSAFVSQQPIHTSKEGRIPLFPWKCWTNLFSTSKGRWSLLHSPPPCPEMKIPGSLLVIWVCFVSLFVCHVVYRVVCLSLYVLQFNNNLQQTLHTRRHWSGKESVRFSRSWVRGQGQGYAATIINIMWTRQVLNGWRALNQNLHSYLPCLGDEVITFSRSSDQSLGLTLPRFRLALGLWSILFTCCSEDLPV